MRAAASQGARRRPKTRPSSRRARLAALLAALVLGLAIWLTWRWLGGQQQAVDTAQAYDLLRSGGPAELRAADRALTEALAAGPDDPCLHAARDLTRAQLWAEYGLLPEQPITEHAEAAEERCRDARLTDALLTFAAGDRPAAAAALAELDRQDLTQAPSFAPEHARWLAAKIALAADDPEALTRAAERLSAALARDPERLALARLLAELQLRRGDPDAALATVRAARQRGPDHLGLAADEALLLAAAGRELSSVADLADQLLAIDPIWVGPYDRGRALVARALVDVHSGEAPAGLDRLDAALPLVAPWDRLTRRLAIDLSFKASDSARALTWAAASERAPTEAAIDDAWALLVDGKIMASLAALALLPQQEPRVAYLQGLALVEQQRLSEAGPWITRAQRFFPGDIELEVASARVAIHHGDRAAALRRLRGLAEEQTFAPRAWTGLGEAYLAHGDDPTSLRDAHRALMRATEREHQPAEAMLRLAEVWRQWRRSDPESERRALEWFERAAQTRPELPRYRLALALYLLELARDRQAEPLLRVLAQEPGTDASPSLALARIVLDRAAAQSAAPPAELDEWLARAREYGAEEDAIERLRARQALLSGDRRALAESRRQLAARLESFPEDIDARDLYARVLVALHEDEEAELIIRRGLRSDEDGDGRLFLTLANLELRARKSKQAALHARAAWHRLRESERPTVELLAAADLATRLFVRTDDHSQAQAIARDLTRRLPVHAEAWRLAARTYLATNQASDAKRAIEAALGRAPDDPRLHAQHAQILLRYGSRPKAKAAYERALELTTDPAEQARYREALRRL
ncbi:MAG: tetratricopeptide repeat protein [Nannocystis sp.]|nr:tetratricopeptide repeat protein [Nannocystis sp.]